MTWRAIGLGLLLGLAVSAVSYFNDWVIGQTLLVGNQLPVAVFGTALVLLLALNPASFRLFGRPALHGKEVAVMVAVALAANYWPGSGFNRFVVKATAMPAHWYKTKANWQNDHVMSYVPGGSAAFGLGHIRDWRRLTAELRAGARVPTSPAGRLWTRLDPGARRTLESAPVGGFDLNQQDEIVRALDAELADRGLYDEHAFSGVALSVSVRASIERRAALPPHEVTRLNRWLLASAMPEVFLPPPAGDGWLVQGGRPDESVVDAVVQGRGPAKMSVSAVPWAAWRPTLTFWGTLAILLGLIGICLAAIVHPQWSRRELLPYPIVRFLEEVVAPARDSSLPAVAVNKLFWFGFALPVALHALDGTHAWFDQVPEIPRWFDLSALRELFPNASRFWQSFGIFTPTLYLTVVAFAFFIPSQVSLSLGLSQVLYVALGAWMVSYGSTFYDSAMAPEKVTMMWFGSYVGMGLIIAYTGRRYYFNVVLSALGGRRDSATPSYATWAARLLVVCSVGATFCLVHAGLEAIFAVGFVALAILIFVVMARIVTETGAIHVNRAWHPVAAITGLLGFDAVGPTPFIALALASNLLFHDQRGSLMTAVAHGFRIADRTAGAPPPKLVPWIVVLLVGGFFVVSATTLYLSYEYGATAKDPWGGEYFPALPFDFLSRYLRESALNGTLAAATARTGVSHLGAMAPTGTAYAWMLVGLVLVSATAFARLRWQWWPLHPVLFLVWGSWEISNLCFSFLLGWLVKVSVTGTTGARGYHVVRPMMVGVIAGETLMCLFWIAVGAVYFAVTGKPPADYNVFPR